MVMNELLILLNEFWDRYKTRCDGEVTSDMRANVIWLKFFIEIDSFVSNGAFISIFIALSIAKFSAN